MIHDGHRRGPYITQAMAIEGSLRLAKLDFKLGRSARVSVQKDAGFELVYDSEHPGLVR